MLQTLYKFHTLLNPRKEFIYQYCTNIVFLQVFLKCEKIFYAQYKYQLYINFKSVTR